MAGLTDEEMAALEAKHGKAGLTDEEMTQLEKRPARTIVDVLKDPNRKQRMMEAVGKTGVGVTPEMQNDVADVPGMARSAAMGFTSNMASIPEELGQTIKGNGDGWHTEHPETRAKYMQSVADHPVANVLGAVAQPNPLGKLSAASTAGKVGLAAARVGYSGANGRLAQYMGNPDAQDSNPLDGAKLPMVVQAGAEAASPALGWLAGKFANSSNVNAVNAVAGSKAGITDKLAKKGIEAGEIPALGKKFMDEGLVPTGLNPFSHPVDASLARAKALKNTAGESIGDALRQARTPFDYAKAQEDATARLSGLSAVEKGASGKARTFIDQIGEQGRDTPGDWRMANKLKSDAWDGANFDLEAKAAPRIYRKAVGGHASSIEDQLGEAAGPEAKDQLVSGNKQYGTASLADYLSSNAVSRGALGQKFSVPGAMMSALAGSGMGLAAGGSGTTMGLMGAAGLGASAVLKSRGPNLMAHGMGLASKASEALAPIVNQSPAASAAAGSRLADYMKPMDDEERQKKGAETFVNSTR